MAGEVWWWGGKTQVVDPQPWWWHEYGMWHESRVAHEWLHTPRILCFGSGVPASRHRWYYMLLVAGIVHKMDSKVGLENALPGIWTGSFQ